MWLRYPLAILLAYVAFLLLLRLWLAIQGYLSNLNFDAPVDLPIASNSSSSATTSSDFSFGGGGDFGGGGAGGSWGESVSASTSSGSNGSGSAFDAISFDFDLEELGLLIIAVVALLGGIVASLYVVYIAPVLLAEILVDGLLVGGLYKRVGNIQRNHWLQTAVRKTLVPALLCVLFSGVAGWALQATAPEAKSIGEVWNALTTDKS